MKTLPPLTLDLRRDTLAKGGDFVNVVAGDEQVIARIYSVCGSYDHAGEMVDRVNAYPTLVNNLRKLSIIPTMMHGVQNQVVHDGFRCRVCRSTFKIGAQEIHANDCPLKGTTP